MTTACYVTQVQLFKYQQDSSNYEDLGTVGCAVLASQDTFIMYKIGCYNSSGKYVCTANLGSNNDASAQIAIQRDGFVNIKDDNNIYWALLFENENEARTFVVQCAVAMYGAAKKPSGSITTYDFCEGINDKYVFGGDTVKVRYTSWVVQRGKSDHEIPQLGSLLETNEQDEKPYIFTLPQNHSSTLSSMKGFEGMTVGMSEKGQRCIIVPSSVKKGTSPSTDMCYLIHLIKKKESADYTESSQINPNKIQNVPSTKVLENELITTSNSNLSSNSEMVKYQHSSVIPMQTFNPHSTNQNVFSSEPTFSPPVIMQPLPGFNAEQLDIINRMQEQISGLQTKVKDATHKLDIFAHDYKQNELKTKPMSLNSAQIEATVAHILHETEDMKEALEKRNETLLMLEEKNKQLQAKVENFNKTASSLAEEKKQAIASSSATKIDTDQQIISLQAKLTQILAERGDTSRHLDTVKKLLANTEQSLNEEKGRLKVQTVAKSTAEAKIATTEEQYHEERSRRKILESKCTSLSDERRSVEDDIRSREHEIQNQQRRIEANALHWNQLMEEERQQGESELRDIRAELMEEMSIRDARYSNEEKANYAGFLRKGQNRRNK